LKKKILSRRYNILNERKKPETVTVAVDCFRKNTCLRSPTTGDETCSWLDPKEIEVPIELCIEDRVASLNHEEPLRKCPEGTPRSRTGVIVKKAD
jgi:hypothetical protein